MRERFNLNQFWIAIIVVVALVAIWRIGDVLDRRAIKGAFTPTVPYTDKTREQYEVFKLTAEVEQIRSDTGGRLFWLKLVAVFVTVGGAIGGYLIGQSKASRDRLNFEHRKDVDASYQQIIQELSSDQPVLRSAAAVKLGAILSEMPAEWNISKDRQDQLLKLTKQVLAAALAIETHEKVLKTISIAIVLHKPRRDPSKKVTLLGDVRGLDFSLADARDAYWAKVDFTYADFFKAKLTGASFRNSLLFRTQFREASLDNTVFINSDCRETNFKLANLTNADFTGADLRNASVAGANLTGANLNNARVHGLDINNATMPLNDNTLVNTSSDENGTDLVALRQWLS
jgi:uncharacterized protein YjbI with pentapeptide repeats